jgi:hypothetical protein
MARVDHASLHDSLLMTMQAAVWSVNCGLNENPSRLKKAIDLLRFFTGRLTKILLIISVSFFVYDPPMRHS